MTLESLKHEFAEQQRTVSEKEKILEKSKTDLKTFYALKEQIAIVYEGKESKIFSKEQAERTLQHYPTINESNYQNIEILIQNELENIEKLQETLLPEQEQLKTTGDLLAMTEKVIGGTYVQSLVREERERRESDFIRCILPCWFLLLWHSKVDTCSTKFELDVFSGKVDTCSTNLQEPSFYIPESVNSLA